MLISKNRNYPGKAVEMLMMMRTNRTCRMAFPIIGRDYV